VSRRGRAVNAAVEFAALCVVVICAAWLASGSRARVDLTHDGAFTLADGTVEILRSLQAPIRVEAFLSSDLPPEYRLHTDVVRDKLADFQAASAAPFEVQYTDPGEDEDARKRAIRLGVRSRETTLTTRGKTQKQATWLGLSIHTLDGEVALPFIDNIALLEYELARGLRDLQTGGGTRTLGIATGHGEPDLAGAAGQKRNPLAPVAAALADAYELVAVDLTAGPVPEAVDALLVLGPRVPLEDDAQWALDQHVMRGGALGVFPLAALPQPQTRMLGPRPVVLDGLLEPWGVAIDEDLVLQRSLNGVLQLPQVLQTAQGPKTVPQQINSPLVPMLRDLDGEHPITRRLDTVVAPFVSPVRAEPPGGTTATVLARSAATSTVGAEVRTLEPKHLRSIQPDETAGAQPVLVALQGALPSAFAGTGPRGEAGLATAPEGTRVLVGGSFEMPLANPGLLLASIDWLAADEQLLAIRPRMSAPRLLERPEPATVDALRLALVVGWPLLVLGAGLLRLRLRGRS
jgi:hypothetical protein